MIKSPRQLRSRLHFEILALLVGHVQVPLLVAEIHRIGYQSRSFSAALHNRKPMLYNYLHRLAEAGWVKIEHRRNRLAVLLTKEGERELARFREWGGTAGTSLVPIVAQRAEAQPGAVRRAFQRIGGGVRSVQAFVSYDVPVGADNLRNGLARALRTAGFQHLHESMWTGDPRRLPALIAWAERQELLPHLQWGAIQVFTGRYLNGRPPRIPGMGDPQAG
ncbi:MAG: hypothetical protein HYY93_14660 [Planctomycetes bacterium]|nr:hypothetical protein [Planctomycetota bacterium]